MAATEREGPKLLLLLGAGASVRAGVPTTVDFVDNFQREVELPPDFKAWLVKFREKLPRGDVEALMRAMASLSSSEDSPELMFFRRESSLASPPIFEKWTSILEQYIRKKCFVPPEDVSYLDPLRKLILNYARPLDIFTVNYDTSIEVLCLTRGIPFNNGFERTWHPDALEKDMETTVRLHKIHGSVTWWATDEGTIVEIPVRIEEPQTRLYYGTRAQTLVIYPGTPTKIAAPLLELLPLLRKRLLEADLCVVAGYSLRDDEVRRILLDSVRDNPKLAVVLIGPSAFRIYEDRLKWAAPDVPSVAQGWVSILPFRFEGLLHNLHDAHLRPALDGYGRFRLLSTAFDQYGSPGQPDEWSYACESLARGGFIELALEVIHRSDPNSWRFEYHLRVLVHLVWIAAWAGAEQLTKALQEHVARFALRMQQSVVVDVSGSGVSLTFRSRAGEGNLDVARVRALVDEVANDGDNYSAYARVPTGGSAPEEVVAFRKALTALSDHLKDRWRNSSGMMPIDFHWESWKMFFSNELGGKPAPHEALEALVKDPKLVARLSAFEGNTVAEFLRRP